MKPTLIVAASILSTLASGLVLPDLSCRSTTVTRPEIAILVNEDHPLPTWPVRIAEASRWRGAHTTRVLLGFFVPACTGTCTISFSDSIVAIGTRRLQLFTTLGYPTCGNTWTTRPPLNIHKGTFLAPNGAGPATVLEDFGLTFPCPATTTKLGFDVSPVGDNDYVIWDIAKGGFIITCG